MYELRLFGLIICLILWGANVSGQSSSIEKRVQGLLDWSKSAHDIDISPVKDSLEFAVKFSRKNKDSKLEAESFQAYIKFILEKVGDYDTALNLLEEINRLAVKTKDPYIRSLYHQSKGRMYMYEEANREKGKEQFRKAIHVLRANDLPIGHSLLNNFGIAEMEDGKFRKAFVLYSQAEEAYVKNLQIGDEDFITILRMNQGLTYLLMDKKDSAEIYFRKAIEHAGFTEVLSDDFSSNLFLGVFLQEGLRNEESIKYLNHAFEIRNDAYVDYGEKALLCTGLADAYSALNQFERAIKYRELEIGYLDTIRRKGISEKAFALEYKSEILALKHQKKIDTLKLKVKEQSFRSRLTLVLLLLVLVVFIGVFVLYRLNKRRQLSHVLAQNEKLEKEKIRQESELEIFRREEKLISANIELSARKNELSSLKGRLVEHLGKSHDPEFDDLKKFLNQLSSSEKRSEQLQYIDHVLNYSNNEFYQRLKELHPNLTDDEMRMATLMRLNLSSKEIEQVFNISNSSLMTKRYRFRKKIAIDKSLSLEDYLKSL